jgi:hypothetical protein
MTVMNSRSKGKRGELDFIDKHLSRVLAAGQAQPRPVQGRWPRLPLGGRLPLADQAHGIAANCGRPSSRPNPRPSLPTFPSSPFVATGVRWYVVGLFICRCWRCLMLTETPVDYERLHHCHKCKTRHTIAVLPVVDGWIVGTRCECRERNGTPRRYSTETPSFPTFQQADRSRLAHLRMGVPA